MNKKLKLILWFGLLAAVSSWVWQATASWLGSSEPWVQENFRLDLVGASFVWLGIIGISFILFTKKIEGITVSLLIAFIHLTFAGFNFINLFGVTLMLILFLLAHLSIQEELKQRFKINSKVLLRKGMMPIVLSMFILISFAAFESPAVQSLENLDKIPSSGEIFIRSAVETVIGSRIEGEDKSSVINQITSETVSWLNTILIPYFEYAPPAVAFALFLILFSVNWLFIWGAIGMGVVIFWVLKKINFVSIQEKEVKAETLVV